MADVRLQRKPMGINFVQCATCKHFRAYERERTVCDAYPGNDDGTGDIPVEIILSEVDHDKPYKGDHGIQREEGEVQMDEPSTARFAYNPEEARDPHGRWTTGGANVAAGAQPGGQGAAWEQATARVQAPLTTRAQAESSTYANLGITSFRGQTTPSMQDVTRYYASTRWKGFENELLRVAAQKHVVVVEEAKAAGVWEGNLEPAATVTVKGSASAIHEVAAQLGARYYQDAVMVWTPHAPQAKGGMYVLTSSQDVNSDLDISEPPDINQSLGALHDAGLPGARIVGHRIEIADDAGETRPQPEQIAKLARSLGLRQQYTPGLVEWLSAGEAYKKGQNGRG